jgi:hypothetical protein
MTRSRRCSIRIRQLRGSGLVSRFTLSVTKRTTRFMLCLRITRKNWKRRCSIADMLVKKTGDLLLLRHQSYPFRSLEYIWNPPDHKSFTSPLQILKSREVAGILVSPLGVGTHQAPPFDRKSKPVLVCWAIFPEKACRIVRSASPALSTRSGSASSS